MRKVIQALLNKAGYNIVPHDSGRGEFPPDFEPLDIEIIRKVVPYTMTSPERLVSLIRAIRYVVQNRIPGDIVECGVWKGGSMMAAALTLMALQATEKNLYLFDTFDGMTGPGEHDVSYEGIPAGKLLQHSDKTEDVAIWAYSPLESVKKNVLSIGYEERKIHFIKGPVEDTIPGGAPAEISLLRLDTDWYESTHHELTHLYPRLARGGILIVDDYGHWQGARKATDQYIAEHKLPLFLSRIDYTGRIAVKL